MKFLGEGQIDYNYTTRQDKLGKKPSHILDLRPPQLIRGTDRKTDRQAADELFITELFLPYLHLPGAATLEADRRSGESGFSYVVQRQSTKTRLLLQTQDKGGKGNTATI